jgi:hypothetical protein
MLLGLITDVHSHADELARALALFRRHGVDRVVTVGDTIDAFARSDGASAVASLLLDADAMGVWGNHDFGLRGDVTAEAQARFPPHVFEFMARMQPRLVLDDFHFSHKEASADPHDAAQLWDISETPLELREKAALGFQSTKARCQFVGHYHRWWAATSAGAVIWQGGHPLAMNPPERYFVVVAAVCDGWCALFDTHCALLEPLWCGVDDPVSDDGLFPR